MSSRYLHRYDKASHESVQPMAQSHGQCKAQSAGQTYNLPGQLSPPSRKPVSQPVICEPWVEAEEKLAR